MQRRNVTPRNNWQATVESQGFHFHTLDDEPYWDESACYEFTAREVDQLEEATNVLYDLCVKAAEHVISRRQFDRFGIPPQFHDLVVKSWEEDAPSMYGRFDLSWNGQGPPRMLEFNADTPTALLEASIIQWYWFEDLFGGKAKHDQFNSIHETLLDSWNTLPVPLAGKLYFCGMMEQVEDFMTLTYLRDTAMQCGIETESLHMGDLGWDPLRKVFTDLEENPVYAIYKLYPWEWMFREEFARNLLETRMTWFEPPWKLILSCKAILPVLWELFPDCPYLLPAGWERPEGDYVRKPVYGREGSNVMVVRGGQVICESDGNYGDQQMVYQALAPGACFEGHYPVIGSWVIGGQACGIGIREDARPVTGNTSRFVPHYFTS